jgi:glycosyltransferase involved in cell wall biosynthesis
MPTFNDAKHIPSSIQSVINQTHKNWELLIMDDGSKDNTEEIVNSFMDSRISYFRQENKGQLVALNNLCSYITGDIVLMLHSDDSLYNSNSLESNLVHFSDPSVDGIYSNLHQFFDSGKPDEIIAAPSRMDKSAVKRLITLLGSNIIFDHFFVRRTKFETNVRYNYFKWYMPFWLDFTGERVTSLNLKFTSETWYHYRVYDQNYTNSVIGNFEVYFTRFRSIFFLSEYMTAPFPLLQKELVRRFKTNGIVLEKRASNKHVAACYKANLRSMRQRTENAFTDYFEKLIVFYQKDTERVLELKHPIEVSYQSCEARKFYNDLRSNNLSPLVNEILSNLSLGFKSIKVKNDEDMGKIHELLNFLCIRANIIIS